MTPLPLLVLLPRSSNDGRCLLSGALHKAGREVGGSKEGNDLLWNKGSYFAVGHGPEQVDELLNDPTVFDAEGGKRFALAAIGESKGRS